MDEGLFWLKPPDLNNFKHLERMSFTSRYSASTCLRKYYFERNGYSKNAYFKTVKGDVIHNSIESLNEILAEDECNSQDDIPIILQNRQTNFMNIIKSEIDKVFEESAQNPRFARLIKRFERKFIAEIEEMTTMLKSGLGGSFNEHNEFIGKRLRKGDSIKKRNTEIAVGTHIEKKLFSEKLNDIGKVDKLVVKDNEVHIIDFKTGEKKSFHKDQLYFYQILWADDKRNIANKSVSKLEIDYLNGTNKNYDPLSHDQIQHKRLEYIKEKEKLLKLNNIEEFTPTINENCKYCFCRQNCDEYWNGHQTETDIEVTVENTDGQPYKVKSTKNDSMKFRLFFSNQVDPYIQMLQEGRKYRVLGAKIDEGSNKITIFESSEIFTEEHYKDI